MMKVDKDGVIYFLSDVHLRMIEDEEELKKRKILIDFLDKVKTDAKLLVFAGDLFDFWFEWRHVVPKYFFPLFNKLSQVIEGGVRIVFVTGNHDFYWGDHFLKEIGIECSDNFLEFDSGGKKFFITHGDGVSKKDRGYRFMKKFIRNRFTNFMFRNFIHPDIGIYIAKKVSHSSRKLVKINKEKWQNEYFGYAKQKFEEGYDYVIMGHLHTPEKRTAGRKVYINCGDWITQFSYASYIDGKIQLRYFLEK